MQKYPKYKPSDVHWIGEIPEQWEVKKLGNVLYPISEKNHPDWPLLSITREEGVILRDLEDDSTNHNYIPDDLSNYKSIRRGEFGMNKMKAWQGSYGVSDYDGIVSPAYYIFKFMTEINPQFFHTAIRSKTYVSFFGSASDGVRIGQWDLSKERMKNIPFIFPPLPEQKAIAEFLDDKTAKLDEAVRIKEKEIELLKERRQIIIQEVVTGKKVYKDGKWQKPDKTKPSGVEWIGEIPEDWEVRKLKYLLNELNVRSIDGSEVLLSLSKYKGVIPKSELEERAGGAASLIGYKIVKKNHMVINKMQAVNGLIAVSNLDGITSPDYSIYYSKDDKKLNIFYLCHLILQPQYLAEFKRRVTGVMEGFIRLYTDDLYGVYVSLPTIKEQNQIVFYLEEIESKINQAISIKEEEIEKLKEYKTVLIDNVVTGKIKVS